MFRLAVGNSLSNRKPCFTHLYSGFNVGWLSVAEYNVSVLKLTEFVLRLIVFFSFYISSNEQTVSLYFLLIVVLFIFVGIYFKPYIWAENLYNL